MSSPGRASAYAVLQPGRQVPGRPETHQGTVRDTQEAKGRRGEHNKARTGGTEGQQQSTRGLKLTSASSPGLLPQSASTARSTLLGDPSSAPSTSRLRSSVSAQSHAATSSSLIPPSSPTHESPFSFRPNNPRPNQPYYQAPDRASHALREDTFANQAENQLDVLIAQGREVLGSLVEQRSWLKGTRKRLLDAANGVKGGREVVGWVERRR